jgi:hypothetical protein
MNFKKTTFTKEEQLNFVGTKEVSYKDNKECLYETKNIIYLNKESVNDLLISNLLVNEYNIPVLRTVDTEEKHYEVNQVFENFESLDIKSVVKIMPLLQNLLISNNDVILVKFDSSTGTLHYQEMNNKDFEPVIEMKIENLMFLENVESNYNVALKAIRKLTDEEKKEIIRELLE